MKLIETMTITPNSSGSFSLREKQDYRIVPIRNIKLDNPQSDSVFQPLDSSKILINKIEGGGKNVQMYEVKNDSGLSVSIEVFQIE